MARESKAHFLAIDVGTQSVRAALVDEAGDVLCLASQEHGIRTPKPGWAEHDAEDVWWHDFVVLCRKMLSDSGINPAKIEGVGVSAIAPCVLPIDKDGYPLRPGILYGVDTRASQEIDDLEREIGNILPSFRLW